MLFDLRGRGRKNTVRVIYVLLACLMGFGLIGFGIGGATNGGLFDVFSNGGASSDSGTKRFEQRERQALRRIQANPKDEAAYIDLIRARVSLAGVGDRYDANSDTYTAAGKAQLRKAADAWTKYQALNPKLDDAQARVASLMVRTYASLNDLSGATGAQEVVAQSRDTAGAYSQLAILAYQAGQTRKGDLAGRKALAKTDKDLRQQLKAQLDQAKSQGAAAAQTTG
jgi:hypothetical protein